MKYRLALALTFIISINTFAQEEETKERGWKRENMFVGTSINLGFFNGFIVGLNPEIGYSINKVIDAGISTNFNYISQNDQFSPITYRQTVLGGGPFVRIWPVRVLFIGGQFEYNSINFSVRDNQTVIKEKLTAPSLLVGIGYGNRTIGASQFYTSIYIDVLKNANSPYTDQFNRMLPVFRTAFIVYLRPKRQ